MKIIDIDSGNDIVVTRPKLPLQNIGVATVVVEPYLSSSDSVVTVPTNLSDLVDNAAGNKLKNVYEKGKKWLADEIQDITPDVTFDYGKIILTSGAILGLAWLMFKRR